MAILDQRRNPAMLHFTHKIIGSKDVYIVRDHHQVLLPWSITRSQLGQAPNLISLDHHTDTRPAFLAYALDRSHARINSIEREILRRKLVAALHCDETDSIQAAIGKLKHDEHISAATSSGIIDFAFVIQLMDSTGTALPDAPKDKILVVPTVCMPGCQNSPHNYECKNTLYDNVLDSSFLGPKLEEADRMSSICGIPSSRCKSYILDIDLDYFHTRKSVDPGDLKVFSWLVKGSSAITIALEPECVKELQVDGADLSAEYLLSRIESHIKRIE
jgi:hypothetical protein